MPDYELSEQDINIAAHNIAKALISAGSDHISFDILLEKITREYMTALAHVHQTAPDQYRQIASSLQ